MKNQIITTGIILNRVNYGEADRIITMLTPDNGKLSMMARGVRRHKSKLAGGVELFSTSSISYLPGRGEVGTLISSRLIKHYDQIVVDINRVQTGYDLIKILNKSIEDNCDPQYYHLLESIYQALNVPDVDLELVRAWFYAQMLRISGHTPNLYTDSDGQNLVASEKYNFDSDNMLFTTHKQGRFEPNHIKGLRLMFSDNSLQKLRQVEGLEDSIPDVSPLLRTVAKLHIIR